MGAEMLRKCRELNSTGNEKRCFDSHENGVDTKRLRDAWDGDATEKH